MRKDFLRDLVELNAVPLQFGQEFGFGHAANVNGPGHFNHVHPRAMICRVRF
jgi:hypothetical protein